MRLYDLAHARTGDKGDISDISVIAYRRDDYEHLRRTVTADRVKDHFADIHPSRVDRYEMPQLGALKFVLYDALGGGVTRTLNLDIHGKSLSFALLEMELPHGPQEAASSPKPPRRTR